MNDPMMPNQGFDFENGTQMEEGFWLSIKKYIHLIGI